MVAEQCYIQLSTIHKQVAIVMLAISHTHIATVFDHSVIFARRSYSPICTPSNTPFLGPTYVNIPNIILIGSAIYARMTVMTNIQLHGPCSNSLRLRGHWLMSLTSYQHTQSRIYYVLEKTLAIFHSLQQCAAMQLYQKSCFADRWGECNNRDQAQAM